MAAKNSFLYFVPTFAYANCMKTKQIKMNFKALLSFLFTASILLFTACKSDDEYPKTVNIKFEISTSNNPEAEITTTINNNSEIEEIESFPYSRAYTQQEVTAGTYLKLTLDDRSDCATIEDPTDPNPNPTNCDFRADLSILIDNEVVKTGSFELNSDVNLVLIDYTFD